MHVTSCSVDVYEGLESEFCILSFINGPNLHNNRGYIYSICASEAELDPRIPVQVLQLEKEGGPVPKSTSRQAAKLAQTDGQLIKVFVIMQGTEWAPRPYSCSGQVWERVEPVFHVAQLRHEGAELFTNQPHSEGYFWAVLHSGRMGPGSQGFGVGTWAGTQKL